MKKHFRKLASVMLALSLIVTMLPTSGTNNVSAAAHTLQNPSKNSSGDTVWDCIWFGSYPQAEVIPSGDYTALGSGLLQGGDTIVSDSIYNQLQNAAGWDENGDITINGNKYRRIKQSDATYSSDSDYYYNWSDSTTYHYFKYEPIKWRVLNVNGNDAFLLADKGLDDQRYNTGFTDVTWENSTIRSWLNGYGANMNVEGEDYSSKNFIGTAFNNSEQSAIKTTSVINNDNIDYGTNGGNNTNDKVFLLSESEVYTDNAISYGFDSDSSQYDEARRSKSSTYAKAMGEYTDTDFWGNCWWWLRSPGFSTYYASFVFSAGFVYRYGGSGGYMYSAVRPALHLNLSSSNLYSYAGTVCSDGTVDEEGMGASPVEPDSRYKIMDAGITNTSSFATSTDSVLGYNTYASLVNSLMITNQFSDFTSILTNKNDSYTGDIIIPGLAQTNQGNNTVCRTMVPQGVCVAGDYILVSACDENSEVDKNSAYKHVGTHDSVIYVLNKDTKKYITTMILKDNKCHVGALSWNGKSGADGLIYIADSTEGAYKVWKVPYPAITDAVSKGADAVYLVLDSSFGRKVNLKPGFLTYYGGYVYVGQFNKNDNAKMVSYDKDLNSESVSAAITLPVNTQGISFTQGKDGNTYLFTSASYGRKNKSKIYIHRAKMNGNRVASINTVDMFKKPIVFPNMSEDICIDGSGLLYTAYESAANIYHLNLDESSGGSSKNPVDRITVSSVSGALELAGFHTGVAALLRMNTKEANSIDAQIETYEDDVVLTGKCGENLEFVLYDEGTLCITGYGDMDDYDNGEAPWSSYAGQITNLCIGADVASIGNYAFYKLPNLTEVKFSDFLYDENAFSIGQYAFADCDSLVQLQMPDVAFAIDDTAFLNDHDVLLNSDSESVSDYCDAKNITSHTHTYEYKEHVDPTCSSYGYDVYICGCGEEMQENFVNPTDAHKYELISDTLSTCLQYGVKEYQCSECGAYYEEKAELSEHCWDNGKVTVEPRPDAAGIMTYTCDVCGETKEETIDKLTGEITTTNTPEETNNSTTTNAPEVTNNITTDNSNSKSDEIKNTTEGITMTNTPEATNKITTDNSNSKSHKITKVSKIKKIVAKKKSLKILWTKKAGVKGYQIQYSTNRKFKKAKKITIKKANITSKIIKKLKAKKKYYVRIRTYIIVNGKKKYSNWSKTKSKITK